VDEDHYQQIPNGSPFSADAGRCGALLRVVIAGKLGTPSNPGQVLKNAPFMVLRHATQILYSASMIWDCRQWVNSSVWLGLSLAWCLAPSGCSFTEPLIAGAVT